GDSLAEKRNQDGPWASIASRSNPGAHMNMSVRDDPSSSTARNWLKAVPWVAGLAVVILVVWGVKVAWEREEPKLPSLQTVIPNPAPKPAPEPYLDISA